MALFDCAELLAKLQLRGMIPVAAGSWSAAAILEAASDESLVFMLPLLIQARGEYLVRKKDISLVQGTDSYRLPYRAAALREAKLVREDSVELPITVIEPEKETLLHRQNTAQGVPQYAVFEDGNVRLIPVPQTTGQTLRVKFHIRPNRMTDPANAVRITVITPGATTTVFTVTSIPAAMNAAPAVDAIRRQSPFGILGYDLAPTSGISTSGTSITLNNSDLPTGPDALEVGDYFALAGYTPFPNFPPECHVPVAIRGIAVVVRSKGDKTMADDLANQAAVQEKMLLTGVLTPRSKGNNRKFVNRRFF